MLTFDTPVLVDNRWKGKVITWQEDAEGERIQYLVRDEAGHCQAWYQPNELKDLSGNELYNELYEEV